MSTKKTVNHAVEVKRHDGPILLPTTLAIPDAITALQREHEAESQEVAITETVQAFPWDGAIAFAKAIEKLFGVVLQTATPTIFGPQPPKLIAIECGPGGQTKMVPWGRFTLPGIEGWVETGTGHGEHGVCFAVNGVVRRRHEAQIKALVALTRAFTQAESIYRGQALEVAFSDDDGDDLDMPEIRFLTLPDQAAIFSADLEAEIERSIMVPIRHADACRKAKVPLKRGILAAGPFGTGKTLLAANVAREATAHGWTYLYVKELRDLEQALRFARRFSPAVVFGEDVDRYAADRTEDEVNRLLNTLDGVDGKRDEIFTILTSNHAERIDEAFRRPGRIDVVLPIMPPDAEASERLVRAYAGAMLADPAEDLSAVGAVLAGQIPAVIREAVERSKLEAFRRTRGASGKLVSADIAETAKALLRENALFRKPAAEVHPMEHVGRGIAHRLAETIVAVAVNGDERVTEAAGTLGRASG